MADQEKTRLLKKLISEMVQKINEFDLGNVDSKPINPPSSIVTNPPLDLDNVEQHDFEEDQTETSDAEQMSVQQIAKAIEDTVITDVNSESQEQQQLTEAEINKLVDENIHRYREDHPFRRTLCRADVLISINHNPWKDFK